jgi:LmbE family N-acetylglucosaminyl deacetylase
LAVHPGAVVATVFAGVPDNAARCTDWDRRSGFTTAAEAVAARRAEDRHALALLGAEPVWLDFADDQYDQPRRRRDVVDALRRLLRQLAPATVLAPLGLYHRDHRLAHQCALIAAGAERLTPLLAYEDAIYCSMPGLLQARLASLQRRGIRATPARMPRGDAQLKQRALAAYVSQRRAFPADGWRDAVGPERCWHLAPPAHGS